MTYIVLRINGDPADTYAVAATAGALHPAWTALDVALPDFGDVVEVAYVEADDPGAARLADADWAPLDRNLLAEWHGPIDAACPRCGLHDLRLCADLDLGCVHCRDEDCGWCGPGAQGGEVAMAARGPRGPRATRSTTYSIWRRANDRGARPMTPEIRKTLVLTTEHVPPEFFTKPCRAYEVGGWYVVEHGALVWVPDSPDESAEVSPYDGDRHPALLALRRYARSLGCDYILLDADAHAAPADAGVRLWRWP